MESEERHEYSERLINRWCLQECWKDFMENTAKFAPAKYEVEHWIKEQCWN